MPPRPSSRWPFTLSGGLLAAGLAAAPAVAQPPSPGSPGSTPETAAPTPAAAAATHYGASAACLAAIPADRLVPAPVYLRADEDEFAPLPAAALPALDALVGQLAGAMRQSLGPAGDALPAGDGRLDWRTLHQAGATLVLRRQAPATWRAPRDVLPDAPGARLVLDALAASAAAGALPPLPDDVPGDSLVVPLVLERAEVQAGVGPQPYEARFAVGVASLRVPPTDPATVRRLPRVSYPGFLAPVEGMVVMRYVVDTTGRVDRATMRDWWPARLPPLHGELRDYYRRLVGSVRDALPRAEFTPARLGGCAIRRLVRQEFVFEVRG